MRKTVRFPTLPMRLLMSLLLVLAAAGCDSNGSTKPANGNEPLAVTTLQVKPAPLSIVLSSVGRTEGSKEVEVRARVSGILKKRVYSEGMSVKAGAVMFQIDPVPFEIALEHARATLAGEQARNQQARRNAERLRELVAQNLVSRNETDNAISMLEASEAAILEAQADVREAQLNLSYTTVTAPIGGITGRALHSEGSLVTAGTDSSLLTTVTQTDPVWVRFALSQSEYESLRNLRNAANTKAPTVTLLHNDGTEYPAQGRINFAGSTVDTSLGTVQLRAEFPNPDLTLLPGEYAQVRLSATTSPGIAVPQAAVLQGAKGPYVWIVNAQSQAEQRSVKTGNWIGTDWRIQSGLAEGDALIIDNLQKLKPGLAVTPQPASAP